MNREKKRIGFAWGIFASLELAIGFVLANFSGIIRQDLLAGLGLPYSSFWGICSLLPVAGLLLAYKKLPSWTETDKYLPIFAEEPVIPEYLLSRNKEIKNLQKRLKKEKIIIVGGNKGTGKSLFAAEYYTRYKGYYNSSFWLANNKSIEDSFLKFGAEHFLSEREQNLPQKKRLDLIFAKLSSSKDNSLLVVDNVNEPKEMKSCLLRLGECENLHILITTRISQWDNEKYLWISEPKSKKTRKLFKKYSPHSVSEKLLKEVIENLGNNVFSVKLLAQNFNTKKELEPDYTLQQMVDAVQKSLLTLSKSKKISFTYKSSDGNLQVKSPEDMVMAMYEVMELSEQEKQMLSALVVLPKENILWDFFEKIYPDLDVEKAIRGLADKGWINLGERRKVLSICKVVEDAIRFLQKDRLFQDCKPMIEQITFQLSQKEILATQKSGYCQLLLRYTFFIMDVLGEKGKEIAVLNGALGNYHKNEGDMVSSLSSYGKACLIFEDLCQEKTKDNELKYNLAVSYYKLGTIHKELEDIDKALRCFERNTKLIKNLHDAYPRNISMKSGLASSFDVLGLVHRELENSDKAKACYRQCLALTQNLCQASPEDISFKKRLVKSYENLGEIYKAKQILDKALDCFEEGTRQALQVCKELAKDVDAKKDLVQLFSKLGLTQMTLGRFDLALKCFTRENSLYQQMFKHFSKELFWKQGLAVSYEKMGSMQSRLGELDEAQKSFGKEIALFGELCKSFPRDTNLENGLAVSYAKLATFYRAKRKDARQARHYFGKAKSLWGNLAGQFPQNKMFAKFLGNVEKDLQRLR